MLSRQYKAFRAGGKKSWLFGGFALLVVIVIVSMIAGIVMGPSSSKEADSSYGKSYDGSASYPAAAPQPTYAAAPTVAASSGARNSASGASSSTAPASQSDTYSSSSQPLPADRLIIRNATLSLEATDVDKTLQEVRSLAIEKNGTVFQSSSTVRSEKSYATITIQVPSNLFDDTMNRLRQLKGVTVESENSTSQDVTEEYVDLQAQVNNLKATETELTRLLGKANSVTEVLTVQRELTNVRGEIERRQGRLNYLDKRTSMSSITINLSPVGVPATTKEPGDTWNPWQVLDTAWAGSLRGLRALFTVAVTLGAWAIWLVPLLGLSYLLFRRLRHHRPAAPAAPTAD